MKSVKTQMIADLSKSRPSHKNVWVFTRWNGHTRDSVSSDYLRGETSSVSRTGKEELVNFKRENLWSIKIVGQTDDYSHSLLQSDAKITAI